MREIDVIRQQAFIICQEEEMGGEGGQGVLLLLFEFPRARVLVCVLVRLVLACSVMFDG